VSEPRSERGARAAGGERTACPACGAALETPLGCHACGRLLEATGAPSPFAILGLRPAWSIDKADLKRRLLRTSRLVHPDFHGTSTPAARALAETNAALLNGAYEVLLDDFLRADWLLAHRGGPSDAQERQMPAEFLMEVLEWNEELDEAESTPPGSPMRAALDGLARRLREARERQLEAAGAALEDLDRRGSTGPERLVEIRRALNAVRYLSRALLRIRDIRFPT